MMAMEGIEMSDEGDNVIEEIETCGYNERGVVSIGVDARDCVRVRMCMCGCV